ncbi:MAG: hypothetical protein ACOWYE_13880 [Desulfatiglandales bacterium]
MDSLHDYFVCEDCGNKDFKPIYNFSVRFYGVNFSDELIYDKLTDETFQCTKCAKVYTAEEIESNLSRLKRVRKKQA